MEDMTKVMLGHKTTEREAVQKGIAAQLEDVLEKVQSARRHLPFSGVPDGYLYQAEGMLQEILEKVRKV
jgi:hypothetical protein